MGEKGAVCVWGVRLSSGSVGVWMSLIRWREREEGGGGGGDRGCGGGEWGGGGRGGRRSDHNWNRQALCVGEQREWICGNASKRREREGGGEEEKVTMEGRNAEAVREEFSVRY